MPYERAWETRLDEHEVYFIVRLRDIPAVAGDGVTKGEALKHFRAAFDDYFAWAIEEHVDIPVPSRAIPPTRASARGRWIRPTAVGSSRSDSSAEDPPLSAATGIAEPSTDRRYEMSSA